MKHAAKLAAAVAAVVVLGYGCGSGSSVVVPYSKSAPNIQGIWSGTSTNSTSVAGQYTGAVTQGAAGASLPLSLSVVQTGDNLTVTGTLNGTAISGPGAILEFVKSPTCSHVRFQFTRQETS